MLDFSMYQSGIDFKCPYSNRPLKPLTPRLNAIFVLAVDRITKSPYLFNWSMSSAIGLYTGVIDEERCETHRGRVLQLGDARGERLQRRQHREQRTARVPPENG
jgi:hypothetical protein